MHENRSKPLQSSHQIFSAFTHVYPVGKPITDNGTNRRAQMARGGGDSDYGEAGNVRYGVWTME